MGWCLKPFKHTFKVECNIYGDGVFELIYNGDHDRISEMTDGFATSIGI